MGGAIEHKIERFHASCQRAILSESMNLSPPLKNLPTNPQNIPRGDKLSQTNAAPGLMRCD
jgi:hypothetical protein